MFVSTSAVFFFETNAGYRRPVAVFIGGGGNFRTLIVPIVDGQWLRLIFVNVSTEATVVVVAREAIAINVGRQSDFIVP